MSRNFNNIIQGTLKSNRIFIYGSFKEGDLNATKLHKRKIIDVKNIQIK